METVATSPSGQPERDADLPVAGLRAPLCHLRVEVAGSAPRFHPLREEPVVIGSGPRCHVRIDSQVVATEHAVVRFEAVVTDLGAGCGVLMGGRKVYRDILDPGTSFTLDTAGTVRITLASGPVPEAAPTTSVPAREQSALDSDLDAGAMARRVHALENEKASLEARIASLQSELVRAQATLAASTEAPAHLALQGLHVLVFGNRNTEPPTDMRTAGAQVEIVFKVLLGALHRQEERAAHILALPAPSAAGAADSAKDAAAGGPRTIDEVLRRLAELPPAVVAREFETHLFRHFRRWNRAALTPYRRGVKEWVTDFRSRLDPRTIERACGIQPGRKGVNYSPAWEHYRSEIASLDAELIVQQIDELVERFAHDLER